MKATGEVGNPSPWVAVSYKEGGQPGRLLQDVTLCLPGPSKLTHPRV